MIVNWRYSLFAKVFLFIHIPGIICTIKKRFKRMIRLNRFNDYFLFLCLSKKPLSPLSSGTFSPIASAYARRASFCSPVNEVGT